MKPNMKRGYQIVLSFLLLAGITLLPASGQRLNEGHPGYVDLERIGDLDDFFDDDDPREVNVEGPLMRLVAEASRFEDPELADLLLTLDGVYVLGYPLDSGDLDDFNDRASMIGRELEDRGWTVVVKYRDEDENVRLYVKMDGVQVSGMVVMSVEKGSRESVFVNIVGDIDPEKIGRIGQKFNIGGMKDL